VLSLFDKKKLLLANNPVINYELPVPTSYFSDCPNHIAISLREVGADSKCMVR
jgi:hypothetical protein